MKTLYYIKTTLKGMISNGVVTVSYFILFPILIACFMGFFQGMAHESPLTLKPVDITIIDEDKSNMSKELVNLLETDNIKEIVNLVDEKPDAEIIIKKGYEENVLSLNKGNIVINKKVDNMKMTIDTLKVILDKYHQKLYVSIKGGDIKALDNLDNEAIIENVMIDAVKTDNPYKKMASSMIGFVITMLIFTMIQSGYADISMNLEKRIIAAPITRLQYLFYDTAALVVYVFIIITAYVMFFRIAGLSFNGNFLALCILIILSTILVVAIAKGISTLFGAKYGKIVGSVIFALPLISGEIFVGEANKIAVLTPTHYLNNAFSIYNTSGNLDGCGKWIAIVIIISLIVYTLAVIKAWISGVKKVCN